MIVTGGASGLGAAIVDRFIREGASVAVLDRSAEDCATLTGQYGDRVVTVNGDVRSYADNSAVVEACVAAFGKVDCAVGNAGIWDYNVPLIDLDGERLVDTFHEIFDINVLGYTLLARAAVKPLAQSRGAMVFTVSNAGFAPAGGGRPRAVGRHGVDGVLLPHHAVDGARTRRRRRPRV